MSHAVSSVVSSISHAVSSVVSSVSHAVSSAVSSIAQTVNNVVSTVSNAVSNAWNSMTGKDAPGTYNNPVGFGDPDPDKILKDKMKDDPFHGGSNSGNGDFTKL